MEKQENSNNQQEENSNENTNPKHFESDLSKERNSKIEDINTQVSSYEECGQKPKEELESNYEEQMEELQDLKISEESKGKIYNNLVGNELDFAKEEKDRIEKLRLEKEKLTLHNNLELGKNAEEQISKARELIKSIDSNGEKSNLFDEALNYYSKEAVKFSETPVYHSTGSFALMKILQHGAIDSHVNNITGEQHATYRHSDPSITNLRKEDLELYLQEINEHDGSNIGTEELSDSRLATTIKPTSLAVDGYKQREEVSRYYAKKAENSPKLLIDKDVIMNTSFSGDLVKYVVEESLYLKGKEKEMVLSAINKLKESRDISDQELIEEKSRDIEERKHHLDPEDNYGNLKKVKKEHEEAVKNNDFYNAKKLEKDIEYFQDRIETYESASEEEKREMEDPFAVILSIDGSEIPSRNLNEYVSSLICERQTDQPISIDKIKKIEVPKSKTQKTKQWLNKAVKKLPRGSEERKAIEDIEVVPLEYLEVKRLIQAQ